MPDSPRHSSQEWKGRFNLKHCDIGRCGPGGVCECVCAKCEPGLPDRVLALCEARGWDLHWTSRGAYLHLESSELIEAVRGKRGTVKGEAADVLIVLMSITQHNGVSWDEVLAEAERKLDEVAARPPRYPGEEVARGSR